MKTWQETKTAFLNDHLKRPMQFPDQRLRAFEYLERALKEKYPELLKGDTLFTEFTKEQFEELYTSTKGRRLNRHDRSVISGLFKLFV